MISLAKVKGYEIIKAPHPNKDGAWPIYPALVPAIIYI